MPRTSPAAPEAAQVVAQTVPAAELPVLALSRPRDAATAAEQLLARTRDRAERSYARQALGIAARESGNVRGGITQLRAALVDARFVGPERAADVQASLGATLAFAGRTSEATRHLDAAAQQTSGAAAARICVRRGFLLQLLGRTSEAVHELRQAARTLRSAGDAVWEARALINLAQALIDMGSALRAAEALTRAESLLQNAGESFEAAVARHNRGLAAALLGQVPEALAHYDAAESMYMAAGARPPELSEARCAALLAGGLPLDALRSGSEAVELLRGSTASPTYRANALVRAGEAALAAGDPALARAYADEAVLLFRRQGRGRGETLARLDVVRARSVSGEQNRRLLRDAAGVASAADRFRVAEAIEAHLLAGQVALGLGERATAETHLQRAAQGRSRGSALSRVLGWHATALRAQSAGRRPRMFEACERGLATLDAHQQTLGALELRAAATSHGAQLVGMAISEAVAMDDPRLLLTWAERWRATVYALPPVHPPDDDELAAELDALRTARRRLEAAAAEGRPLRTLERECLRLEDEVRRRTLRMRGGTEQRSGRLDVDQLLDALGGTTLVEVVRLGDDLHVVVASRDGLRQHAAGSLEEALHEAEFARFGLRRLAYDLSSESEAATLARLDGAALEKHILGSATADLGEGPVVLALPSALHSVPWGLLPSLAERAFSVVPSGAAWLQSRAIQPPDRRSVTLVAGPGLDGCGAEVLSLAAHYPDADLLRDGSATSANVLSCLEGRWLVHVAAHGTFRADNPLFSSLLLDDGPLTLVDLQRLHRAPYRLVANSCSSGASSAAGADELLGLANALGTLGTAGLLAAVVPVRDEAAGPFSLLVHSQLRSGATSAEALRGARLHDGVTAVGFATARSFVPFGAV